MTPLFSVVVPTYNRVGYLRRALESVRVQSLDRWECLICDDCSTDGSIEYVRELSSIDNRFQLIMGPRFGLPAGPRNRGIKHSTAPWIAFLDDDDIWYPDKLRYQAELTSRDCSVCSVRSWPYAGDTFPSAPVSVGGVACTLLSLEHVLLQLAPYPTTPATAVRRDLLLKLGGFNEHPAYRALEDYDMWCRLLNLDVQWLMGGEPPLVAFRTEGSDSISANHSELEPDGVRQQWAKLECLIRFVSSPLLTPSQERRVFLRIVGSADDCAWRSLALGWLSAATVGFAASAYVNACLNNRVEVAKRLLWTLRSPMRIRGYSKLPSEMRFFLIAIARHFYERSGIARLLPVSGRSGAKPA